MDIKKAKLLTKIAKKKLAIAKEVCSIEKYEDNLKLGRLKILSKTNLLLSNSLKKTYEKELIELELKLENYKEK